MSERPEPQFDVIVPDVMTGLAAGAAVQEAELDATVRTHPWCPPGQMLIMNRAALPEWARQQAG